MTTPQPIGQCLDALQRAELIGDLDAHFAAFLCRQSGGGEPLALAAALASRATGEGHVCVDLGRYAGQGLCPGVAAPTLSRWLEALRTSDAVTPPGGSAPLVLDGARLYLYRYWDYERQVAAQLLARATAMPPAEGDSKALRAALARWFPVSAETDWQQIAAAVAASGSLTVISGGPGTGKTTTVMRALAILAELAPAPLRMALAAPTGKAAARLQEALRQARAAMPLPPDVDAQLPQEASTLHRLLGVRPGRTRFRHDRDHPLPLDVLVVDEASMIDLALMAKLLEALPPQARLVVLGDKDQLASVEAGAVLHSLCAGPAVYGAAMAAHLQAATGYAVPQVPCAAALADRVVLLRKRYRFQADSGIAALADAARDGDAEAVLRILATGAEDLHWHAETAPSALAAALADRYAPLVRAARDGATPETVHALLREQGVLCAHRTGMGGAVTLNRGIEAELRRRGLIDAGAGEWFAGRPVMVRRNDYATRLYNGDVGVALDDGTGRLGVYFPDETGALRRFAPARLPDCDSAFAMTVHKSQGSEFGHVDVVLPGEPSPVLTRELFYTAVTRASGSATVWGRADIVRAAVSAQVIRDSALVERLWPAEESVPVQGVLF